MSFVAPLFVPATRPDRFSKAVFSGADAIIIDLEDAVPQSSKVEGRSNLVHASTLPLPVIVRINGEGTDWHEADLEAVKTHRLLHICVPKTELPETIDRVAAAMGPDPAILALVESAAGLENARAIAEHGAVRQLAFGPADFFLDMDMPPSAEMTAHALCRLATASRAAGKPRPLDGPCFAVSDVQALEKDSRNALRHGAGGKLCIHPSQPALVLACFSPGEDEVAWARRVIEAVQEGGVGVVDGRMVDAPIVSRARNILDRARPAFGEETEGAER